MAHTHFLHNQHDRATSTKRGGRCQIIPLNELCAEEMLASEPANAGSHEHSLDRRWAVTLTRRVMENLRADFESLCLGAVSAQWDSGANHRKFL